MTSAPLRSAMLLRLRPVCVTGQAMLRRLVARALPVIFLLGFPPQSQSSSLGVVIQQSHHNLAFEFWRHVPPFDTPGTNLLLAHPAWAPVSAAIHTNPFTGGAALYAEASSETFGVYAFTPAPYPNDPLMASIRVSATSELEFTPVASDLAALSILFIASGHWFDCSSGSLTLIDLSTDTEIHNLSWYYQSDEFLGGTPPPYSNEFNVAVPLPTFFDFGHSYKLRLHTEVWADNSPRSPAISFSLLGLEPTPAIPEPSGFLIMLLGGMIGWHQVQRRNGIRKRPAGAN